VLLEPFLHSCAGGESALFVLGGSDMRTAIVVVAELLLLGETWAGVVRGRVEDRETHHFLAAANVVIIGTGSGTTTDTSGRFMLVDLPTGSFQIQASLVGYIPQTQTIVISATDTLQVRFTLQASVIVGQPVVVTATRGRDRETPATFSTLEGSALRERYTIQDVPVLLSELPSTTVYSESGTGLGYTYMNIRGFDSRRIAVMVNGIPQNDPEDHNVYWLDFPDMTSSVEDIQVQRGAGSAFYGSPAIGGSVNLSTTRFARDKALTLLAGLGSYDTRKYSASFFSGLIDNRYEVHARLSKLMSNGYRDHAWVDFNSYFLGMIRYDETMTTQVNFYGGPIADGLAYYGIPKDAVKDRDLRRENPIKRPEEIENFSQPHFELMHEWRLSPSIRLDNTIFLILGDGFFDYDGSWAPLSYYRITPSNGFTVPGDPETLYLPGALIRAQVTNKQWGWLPRISVQNQNGELILGGELRVHRSLHWGRLQWAEEIPAGVPLDYRYYEYRGAKDIASIYAHLLQEVSPDLTLMASVQYAFNRYRFYDEKFIGTDFSVPYHFVNPRIGLNYNITDRWNLYTNVGYTSREPRLKNLYDAAEASTPASWGAVLPQFTTDASGNLDYSKPLVKPEGLLDIEFGGNYIAGSSKFAANLYWMEFADEIVKSGQVDRFGQPITGNAERTRHQGLELSGKTTLASILEVEGNISFSRNRFVRHRDYSTGVPITLNGNPIAGFPDVIGNLRLTCRLDSFVGSIVTRFVGKQYTDNSRDEQRTVDSYTVSDLAIGYTFGGMADGTSIEARLQINNLFDQLYAAHGEGDQFFVGAERNLFFTIVVNM
jgi:iron complex outermembrane recepter protein